MRLRLRWLVALVLAVSVVVGLVGAVVYRAVLVTHLQPQQPPNMAPLVRPN